MKSTGQNRRQEKLHPFQFLKNPRPNEVVQGDIYGTLVVLLVLF
jgi:hypothetical protein